MIKPDQMLMLIDLVRIHDRDICLWNCCVKEMLNDLFDKVFSPELLDKMIREHESECHGKFKELYYCHVRQLSSTLFMQTLTFLTVGEQL